MYVKQKSETHSAFRPQVHQEQPNMLPGPRVEFVSLVKEIA